MTAFEDLDDDPGDEAMDELAGTLSSSNVEEDASATDDNARYDPTSDPAFPTVKKRTQHSIYCLPPTWESIDGNEGLLFETEIKLRRDGYSSIQKRELHDALLQAAVENLEPGDIGQKLIAVREEQQGSLD